MIITGGKYKGRKIQAPDEKITRPTLSKVRQGVFNTLFSMIGDFSGKSFLDLFGGSGVMGLEALSRDFDEVYVFEKNPKVGQVLKQNYSKLGLSPNLKIGDSLKLLEKLDRKFDVIYIDPPYYSGVYEEVFELLVNYVQPTTIIIAEHSDLLEIKDFNLIKEKNYGGKLVSFFTLQ
ncbi:MAG: 16S rRNA (guanine(966)-N(2))-methyltransferase RsmD [Cyanobacteria bacterium SIG31]|nr:16S rRNA (guanine(966)-N(2))-methyltransferase RsmD [Cyanobacteria bacterium SIG31]